MSVTYEVKCESCGVKVGEMIVPEPLPDDVRARRCDTGQICDSCAAAQAAPDGDE